jgi:membrane fusion protein (multidrug efflux system)
MKKYSLKKKWFRVSIVILLIVVAIISVIYKIKSANTNQAHGFPTPVETTIAKKSTVNETINTIGDILPFEAVEITSEVAAKLQEISFKEGSEITKDQVLFKLDDNTYEAEVKIAAAELQLAKFNFERTDDLYKKKVVSKQAYEQGLAELHKKEALLAVAKEKLLKTCIKAPFAGVVGLHALNIGDLIQPDQPLVKLENINKLKIDFQIPGKYLGLIKEESEIEFTVDNNPNIYKAKIYAVSPSVAQETKTMSLKALVENSTYKLKPGNLAKIKVTTSSYEAIIIPEVALVKSQLGDIIYLVKDNKAVSVPVSVTSRQNDNLAIISDKISENDMVITAGQIKIYDGANVTTAQGK